MRPEQLAQEVRHAGAAVWPRFAEGQQLVDLRTAAYQLTIGHHALHFPKSTRVWDLYRHGQCFLDLLTAPQLHEVLHHLLGVHFLLSDFSLNVVHPHQPIDDWHIDYPYNEMYQLVSGSLLGLQCVLALDEFTTQNGATQYIPGSHADPRRPAPEDIGTSTVFHAQPGTLLIMAAATWHRSGVNTSSSTRAAILLSFVERWIRPMSGPPETGPWSSTEALRLLLGVQRPPETINGVPVSGSLEEVR